MIPIFYINAAGQTTRRAFMEQQFAALGLIATRFEAITEPDPADIGRYCSPYAKFPLLLPELACSLSHLALAGRIAAGRAPFGAIFEDDAILSATLPAFLAEAERQPDLPDIIKLETSTEHLRMAPRADRRLAGIGLVSCFSVSAGGAGYLLSRRAAAEIVSRRHAMLSLPYDHSLFHPYRVLAHRGLVRRFAVPALCIQSSLGGGPLTSTIDRPTVRPQPAAWFRAARTFANAFERDVLFAPERLWHIVVDRAEKQIVHFAGNPAIAPETQTAGPGAGGALA